MMLSQGCSPKCSHYEVGFGTNENVAFNISLIHWDQLCQNKG